MSPATCWEHPLPTCLLRGSRPGWWGDAGAAALSPVGEDLTGDPGRLRSCSRPVQPRCGGLGQPPSSQAAEGAGGLGIGRNGQAAGSPGLCWGPLGGQLSQPHFGRIPRLPPQQGSGRCSQPADCPPQPCGASPLTRFQTRHPYGCPALLWVPPELVLRPPSRFLGSQPPCFILRGPYNFSLAGPRCVPCPPCNQLGWVAQCFPSP